jgi:hypothetical protein
MKLSAAIFFLAMVASVALADVKGKKFICWLKKCVLAFIFSLLCFSGSVSWGAP